MDALILAAGFGSRMRTVSASKPLTSINGLTLLQLGAWQAAQAGAQRVVVVTGHNADAVESALPSLSDEIGIPVLAKRVEDCARPNGYSVIAGASAIEGDYLLMMADHLFSDSILPGLAAASAGDRGVTLAIDRQTDSELIDPDDATWVQTGTDGTISAIGKSISDYDAVDCGAFLATPELAPAIAAAIAAGRPGSLSDGVQQLADAGRAMTWNIGQAWWMDVDDPRALALAQANVEGELRQAYDYYAARRGGSASGGFTQVQGGNTIAVATR